MPATTPTHDSPAARILTGRTLFRVGLALVLVASFFFLRLVEDRMGPVGWLSLGAVAGAALIAVGLAVSGRRPSYGALLVGGGGAVLYGTAFAAGRVAVLSAGGSLALLAAASGVVVVLALRSGSEGLAVVGVTGALAAAPLVGGIDGMGPVDAASLSAAVAVAALLHALRGWRRELGAVLAGTLLLLGAETAATASSGDPAGPLLAALAVAWVGLALLPALTDPDTAVAVAATASVPFLAYGGLLVAAEPSPPIAAAVGIGMAAVHVGAGVAARTPLLAGAGLVAGGLLAALGWSAVAAGQLLAFAVAAQAVVTLALRAPGSAVAGHVLAAVAGWLWLGGIATDSPAFDAADVAGLGVVVLAAAAATVARRPYGIAALGGGLLWAVSALGPLGAGWATAAWTAGGVALAVTPRARRAGIAVLLAAVARLLVVDTAALDPAARVALFAAMGVALLGIGYRLGDGVTGLPRQAPR